MENYVVIKGNKIELSDSLVEQIKNLVSNDDSAVKEITDLLCSYSTGFDYVHGLKGQTEFLPFIEMVDFRKILYIKMPHSNKEWSMSVFKVINIFCEKHEGSYLCYLPEVARAGYVSVEIR